VVNPLKKADSLGGHAFALVGYNKTGFVVQNSWGLVWGNCGFGVLPYEDWVKHGTDAWIAALGVQSGTQKTSSVPVPSKGQTVIARAGSITLKDADGAREVPIALATADIGAALKGAELIVIPTPAIAQHDIALAMAPHLVDGQVVFLPPGTFGSYVMAKTVKEAGSRADVAPLTICTNLLESDEDCVEDHLLRNSGENRADDRECAAASWSYAIVGATPVEIRTVAGGESKIEYGAIELRHIAETLVAESETEDVRAGKAIETRRTVSREIAWS